MACKIKAIGAYRPRVEQGNTVQRPESIRALSRVTGLVEGSIDQMIKELRDQIIEFNRAGRGVKVEGLGTYAPNISLDGTLDLQYRADTAFGNGLNIPGIFTARSSTANISAKPVMNLCRSGTQKTPTIRS